MNHTIVAPLRRSGSSLWCGLADSSYKSISTISLHDGNEMVAAPRELPVSSYALEVDGRVRAEFATRDGARAGGAELKKRFPMLQIQIYDAQTNAREEI
ncbi:hypothetical protein [Bradyrhizobium sp. Rc3b]|uniref:hypothetical protein n=1 Tax=Bradyrhizobium sp. Rc3b TaxID=1855322 RepID=UPI001FCD8481|nr:hypothetical protein [Bradyrhizobium sp. Rc3b]